MIKYLIVISRVNTQHKLEERRAVVNVFPSSRDYMERQFVNAGWVMKTFMPAN